MAVLHQLGSVPFEAFAIDGLWSDDEVEELRAYVASHRNPRAFTNSGFFNGKTTDAAMSERIARRMRSLLPARYVDASGRAWAPFRGCSRAVMFARVGPGEAFGIHTDTGFEHDPIADAFSKFTVLIYLNDDFEGGTTTFYDDDFRETFRVLPKRGRTLCFDLDLFHSGDPVAGGCKLWLGTELVYGRCRASVKEV